MRLSPAEGTSLHQSHCPPQPRSSAFHERGERDGGDGPLLGEVAGALTGILADDGGHAVAVIHELLARPVVLALLTNYDIASFATLIRVVDDHGCSPRWPIQVWDRRVWSQ